MAALRWRRHTSLMELGQQAQWSIEKFIQVAIQSYGSTRGARPEQASA